MKLICDVMEFAFVWSSGFYMALYLCDPILESLYLSIVSLSAVPFLWFFIYWENKDDLRLNPRGKNNKI